MNIKKAPLFLSVFLFLSLFLLTPKDTYAVTFTRKVFLQNVTSSSVEFRWVTDTAEALIVKYGATAAYGSQVNSDTVTGGTGGNNNHAKIAGLTANTTYYYQVTNAAGAALTLAGDTSYKFKTAPATGASTPFTFAAWGDSGDNSSSQDAVSTQVTAKNPNLVFIAGDIAYGYTTDFNNNNTKHFNHYPNLMRFAPFYVTCGNHESSCSTVMADHSLPGGGKVAGESVYSFDYGNVHFVALNSEASHGSSDPQMTWAANDIRAAKARTPKPWVVVFWHQNYWSAGSHSTQSSYEPMVRVSADAGADVIFWGHSHVYERWNKSATYGNTQIYTIGNGGKKNGSPGCATVGPGCAGKSNGESGFLFGEVNGSSLTMRYITQTGTNPDSVTLTLGAGGPTSPPITNPPATATRPPNATNTPTRVVTTGPTVTCPAITVPGDANGDAKVDGIDFTVWLNHYNQSVGCKVNGDFNNSGRVDGVDFSVWLANYGRGVPTQPGGTRTPTQAPQPTGISGSFPCGKYPNASAGCMPVSFQSWFDNVPASATTMSVNYTPRLLHQHYECNVPAARANGQYLRSAMSIACQFVRYNSIVPFASSNSGWYRSQNQGSTYEQFALNLPPCQGTKYEGKECKSEHVHTVRASDMSSATEMRYTPNANFVGLGGQRHYLSSNWQTGIGYRSSSEFTARYWMGECGTYQRTILRNVDKYVTGNEPIATVKGTVTIPFETNGGCGSQFKTFVFLDPAQHVRNVGTQTGTTLMETNSHFNGNLTWDTTKTTNGIHNVLFINMEGTSQYVSASGVAMRFNVQN